MSKITFRADDDLVKQLETLDASKSEVMREALRAFLEDEDLSDASGRTEETVIDDLVQERIDELLTDRLGSHPETHRRHSSHPPQDVNVTISLEGGHGKNGDRSRTRVSATEADQTDDHPSTQNADHETTCAQCGEHVNGDHVYCPNCGEKRSRRLFCDCGDELRSDWSFCPSCGRRTPAADVLESEQHK